jgi:hypothetical protein
MTRWRLSWKWATKRHACTLAGIVQNCGGRCCSSPHFWPPRVGGRADHGCYWLGPQGCRLSAQDKPVGCHLYPLRLSAAGTLGLHRAAALQFCKGNHGQGPLLVDALRPSLVALFGERQFEAARAEVLAERDAWFDVPPEVEAAYERELEWERLNLRPLPRSAPSLGAYGFDDLTPCYEAGDIWLKRDDLFEVNGAPGGKARACLALAQGAPGLCCASHRHSPQADIVARVAAELGIPARCHTPYGPLTPELSQVEAQGAELVRHKPGWNSVIKARAREDARARGWLEVPFGMECQQQVDGTRAQVANARGERIVVTVGAAMSLAGILWGLRDLGKRTPVLAIEVGASGAAERLAKWGPPGWEEMVSFERSPLAYQAHPAQLELYGLLLDPVYEAKALPYLQPGDCLWVVGIRSSMRAERNARNGGDDAGRHSLAARGPAASAPVQRRGGGSRGLAQVAGAQQSLFEGPRL